MKTTAAVIAAAAAVACVGAVDLDKNDALTTSCLTSANSIRNSAGPTHFPALSDGAADAKVTITGTTDDLCGATGEALAAKLITDNALYFLTDSTTAPTDCVGAAKVWSDAGFAAVISGKPPNYAATAPDGFYKAPNNISFVGMAYGTPVTSPKITCGTITCPAAQDSHIAVICQVAGTPAKKLIADGENPWTQDQYDALLTVAKKHDTSDAQMPLALLGLSATTLGLLYSNVL